MWWLQDVPRLSQRRTPVQQTHRSPRAVPTVANVRVQNAPAQKTVPLRREPLRDLLTPRQHDANRRFLELANESFEETNLLRTDVRSLEDALRDQRSTLESKQVTLDVAHQVLQQERAKRGEYERSVWDSLRNAMQTHRQYESSVTDLQGQVRNRKAQIKSITADLDAAVIENESLRADLRQRNDGQAIMEENLSQIPGLQEQLHEANQQAAQWQMTASQNSTAKHAAREQADRLQCLLTEKTTELNSSKNAHDRLLAKAAEAFSLTQKIQSVFCLRTERLRSQLRTELNQAQGLRNELARSKRTRVRMESEGAVVLQQKCMTIRSLEAVLLQRDRDMDHAWQQTLAYSTRAALHENLVDELRESNAKLVHLQSDQYEQMRDQIENLVARLEGQREESRLLRLAQVEQQQQSERLFTLVSDQRDAFAESYLRLQQLAQHKADDLQTLRDREMQEHQVLVQVRQLQQDLLHETARMRARLSAGRAKGRALGQQHQEKVTTLRKQLAGMEQHQSEFVKQTECLNRLLEQRDAEIRELKRFTGRQAA